MGNKYIKGLDGYRLLAVISVFTYHLASFFMPSGFFGVSIFFVLAGFLSMQSIVDRDTNVSIVSGIKKIIDKIIKLMPPLLIVTILVSLVMISNYRIFLKSYDAEIISSIFNFSNVSQILRNESYFEMMNSIKPLKHIWALSLEFQFYIAFYILIFPFYNKNKKKVFIGILSILYIISLVFSLYKISTGATLTRVYYGFDTRLNGFIIGMILSILLSSVKSFAIKGITFIRIFEYIITIVLIALMFLEINNDFNTILMLIIYPIIFCICIALIFFDINNEKETKLIKICGCNFVHELVKRSYLIYLTHYPIIMFTDRLTSFIKINFLMYSLIVIAATLIITEIIYRFLSYTLGTIKNDIVKIFVIVVFILVCFVLAFVSKLVYTPDNNGTYITTNNIIEDTGVATYSDLQKDITETQNSSANENIENIENKEDISEDDIEEAIVKIKPYIESVNEEIGGNAVLTIDEFRKYYRKPITLIGDSVSECAVHSLRLYFPNSYLNVAANRQLDRGLKAYYEMKEKGEIADVVVVALGTNSDHAIDTNVLETIYNDIEGKPMILLTLVIPSTALETSRNKDLTKFAREHENCYLADWYTAMKTHNEYFIGDGTHPKDVGNHCFAQLIFKAMIEALNGTHKAYNNLISNLSEKNVGEEVTFGSYYINDENMKEPISWIVIDKDEEKKTELLLSKYALSPNPFDSERLIVTWANSDLRRFLSTTFLNDILNDMEKEFLETTIMSNDKNPVYNLGGGTDTYDKIFILSYDEADKYLTDDIKKCKGTNYFKKVGGYVDEEGNADYWLRTSGDAGNHITYVDAQGVTDVRGDFAINDDFGVRPVLSIYYGEK